KSGYVIHVQRAQPRSVLAEASGERRDLHAQLLGEAAGLALHSVIRNHAHRAMLALTRRYHGQTPTSGKGRPSAPPVTVPNDKLLRLQLLKGVSDECRPGVSSACSVPVLHARVVRDCVPYRPVEGSGFDAISTVLDLVEDDAEQ